MDLNDVCDIETFDGPVLRAMAERLRLSRTEEHFIYRETELDQIWRLLDIAIADTERADGKPAARLRELRDAVHEAHDLIGIDAKPQPQVAAARIEAAL